MVKIGDILKCKTSFHTYVDYTHIQFLSDEFYLVTDVYSYESLGGTSYIQVYINNIKEVCNISRFLYDKYFYNKKEMRRMKLEEMENRTNK